MELQKTLKRPYRVRKFFLKCRKSNVRSKQEEVKPQSHLKPVHAGKQSLILIPLLLSAYRLYVLSLNFYRTRVSVFTFKSL